MKAKRILLSISLSTLVLLTGCNQTIEDIAPTIPVQNNPTGVPPITYSGGVRTNKPIEAQVSKPAPVSRLNSLRVLPSQLEITTGQRQALAFALDKPAPNGGLYLNITTDVPNSVIMPEVIIPEGARTVNVTIQGGESGRGKLFVKATGLSELVIPINVQ